MAIVAPLGTSVALLGTAWYCFGDTWPGLGGAWRYYGGFEGDCGRFAEGSSVFHQVTACCRVEELVDSCLVESWALEIPRGVSGVDWLTDLGSLLLL